MLSHLRFKSPEGQGAFLCEVCMVSSYLLFSQGPQASPTVQTLDQVSSSSTQHKSDVKDFVGVNIKNSNKKNNPQF